MSSIKILPEEVRNRIAAGEVLERPAAAVKELAENSLDAGADRIEIEIADGGQSLIRVSDNGSGIQSDEIPLAVLRHATSKISDVQDIFTITSKGFRGEALPSIAAVSRLRISSRSEGEDSGNFLEVEGGKVASTAPCSHAAGTTVAIRDLFYNTPARRKFLKSHAAEASAIRETVTRLALAHPEVSLRLANNGKTVFDLPAHGNALDRIEGLFGREIARSLAPLSFDSPGGLGISGFAAQPPESRATSRSIYTFVNRRWINHPSLTQAVRRSFDGLLPPRRYPVAFLFIALDPSEIDVNVHPTKHDIRFHQERAVLSAVYRAVSESLRGSGKSDAAHERTININNQTETSAAKGLSGGLLSDEITSASPEVADETACGLTGTGSGAGLVRERGAVVERPAFTREPNGAKPFLQNNKPSSMLSSRGTLAGSAPRKGDTHTASMFSVSELKSSSYRVLSQAHDSYLVVECPEGLMLVDQHALHERIIYEELRKGAGAVVSQKLVVPAVVELSNEEFSLFLEVREELSEMGFAADEFGDRTVSVSAVPVVLRRASARTLLRDCLAELSEGTGKRDSLREPLIKTMSCKAAVKAGDRLPDAEVTALLDRMRANDLPFTCPHGRPFAFVIPLEDIRRRFERT